MAIVKHMFNTLISSDLLFEQVGDLQKVIANPIVSYEVCPTAQSLIKHEIELPIQQLYIHVNNGAHCQLIIEDAFIKNVNVEYHIIVEQDAYFQMCLAFFQAELINCTIKIYLLGDRSHADIKGLYALNDNQKVTIDTYQYHQGISSKSNLEIKGMLKDSAHASYQGLIKIDKGASGVNASQQNKNIIVSKDAKVTSIPSIEVLQHDVQCSHGSAIGKFNQEQLWYLQSKGLQDKQGQLLLTKSFFKSVLDTTNHELMERICQKMI